MGSDAPETVAAIVAAHRAATMTPAQTIARSYQRIRAHNDPAVFISLRDEKDALAEAEALGSKDAATLPLLGVPVAIKDNIDAQGLPTTAACPAFSYSPAQDSTAVAKLRAAGAIIIGKTNLDQFATGLVGVRSPYGIPVNPVRADLIPGGSSSGSAVAVSAGLVPLALGTDTAGSGRVPAMLNNIVGLKPSLGLISNAGRKLTNPLAGRAGPNRHASPPCSPAWPSSSTSPRRAPTSWSRRAATPAWCTPRCPVWTNATRAAAGPSTSPSRRASEPWSRNTTPSCHVFAGTFRACRCPNHSSRGRSSTSGCAVSDGFQA
jgi:hypothetical protein